MSEQVATKDQFYQVAYRIERSVTGSGDPLYVLYRDLTFHSVLGGGSTAVRLSENRDRRVLEQAITFLEHGE
jgi:hypothetical protein